MPEHLYGTHKRVSLWSRHGLQVPPEGTALLDLLRKVPRQQAQDYKYQRPHFVELDLSTSSRDILFENNLSQRVPYEIAIKYLIKYRTGQVAIHM